jgi:hypothetical protein
LADAGGLAAVVQCLEDARKFSKAAGGREPRSGRLQAVKRGARVSSLENYRDILSQFRSAFDGNCTGQPIPGSLLPLLTAGQPGRKSITRVGVEVAEGCTSTFRLDEYVFLR